jgi:hypothetical protein
MLAVPSKYQIIPSLIIVQLSQIDLQEKIIGLKKLATALSIPCHTKQKVATEDSYVNPYESKKAPVSVATAIIQTIQQKEE